MKLIGRINPHIKKINTFIESMNSAQATKIINPSVIRPIPCLSQCGLDPSRGIQWNLIYFYQITPPKHNILKKTKDTPIIEAENTSLEAKLDNILGTVRHISRKGIRKFKTKSKKEKFDVLGKSSEKLIDKSK